VGQYSIKDIEKLTGIKAHTIRIWEQRYGLVEPHRTETNIRYYDDDQLKTLLNVSMLVKHGKKISQIAKLTPDLLHQEVHSLAKTPADRNDFFQIQIDSLIISMIELDEIRFEKIISTSTLRYGFETVMIEIIIPFLQKVGLLWATEEINVAQEHFITNLIRRKLIVAIDAIIPNPDYTKKFLLFLPEGELHELGLLFAKYLVKSRGFKTIYLGQSVPLQDIVKLREYYRPDYILTYFTVTYDPQKMNEYVLGLINTFHKETLLLCGPQAASLNIPLPSNCKIVLAIPQLIEILAKANVNQ
jgi:DNA-binding transcriptional MerR regulator